MGLCSLSPPRADPGFGSSQMGQPKARPREADVIRPRMPLWRPYGPDDSRVGAGLVVARDAAMAKDQAWEFLFTLAHARLTGAVQAIINPVAIK
jgi:hypothetical protein